jgi:transcriptional regulator with AAA-type ATPase domain
MDNPDRGFFRKIHIAAFANPFGEERANVDLEISGLDKSSSNEEILAKLVAEVAARIEAYREKSRQLNQEDTALLRYGVLFCAFHQFCEQYDQLISDQLKNDAESLPVPFARDLLRLLAGFGFSGTESLRYLALFFQLRRGFYFISNIVGRSDSVSRLRQALWRNIFTYDSSLYEEYMWNRMEDFSTIILGETGTGKGMAAAAIGRSGHIPFNEKSGKFSESFARAFISINLSQFSEQLIESELFGHTKGAFTGAVSDHKGVFARCSQHGAIFLDEIGEIPTTLQIKLLQVLQEREFSPVGGHGRQKFQGRVIAATNQSVHRLRREGKFRDDFYYRLCSDVIELPSLKQRLDENPGELKEILAVTLQRILGVRPRTLIAELSNLIRGSIPKDYPWPGNIRELEQCVRRMLLNRTYTWETSREEQDRIKDFQERYIDGRFSSGELLSNYCRRLYAQYGTYEKVAAITALDRRTVKKYIDSGIDESAAAGAAE